MRSLLSVVIGLLVLTSCAHPRLMSASPGVFTLGCNDCSESDWRFAAGRYCTVKPQSTHQNRTVTQHSSSFIKYRPVKTRTYTCSGQIIRHPD